MLLLSLLIAVFSIDLSLIMFWPSTISPSPSSPLSSSQVLVALIEHHAPDGGEQKLKAVAQTGP